MCSLLARPPLLSEPLVGSTPPPTAAASDPPPRAAPQRAESPSSPVWELALWPPGSLSPTRPGEVSQAKRHSVSPPPALLQAPLLHIGSDVGGELGAVERTRILHSSRGAEDPPSRLPRGAGPGQEEADTGRTFENLLMTRLSNHGVRQDQPGVGAA